MDSNTIREEQEGSGRLVKSLLSKSKNSSFRKAAASIREGASIGEALQFVADNTYETPQNSLVGNLFIVIAQQWIEKHYRSIYGNIFKKGEPLIGGGINIVIPTNNAVGITTPQNYQTSTQLPGIIAFGDSVSNADDINIKAELAPLMNFDSTGQDAYVPFATINITVPNTFASFSSLTPIKAGEIISTYNAKLQNGMQIYYNNLGNMLFTKFLPKNQYTTTSNNIYQMLQQVFIPLIERLKQFSARYNAGINYSALLPTGTTDATFFTNLDALTQEQLRTVTWTTALPAWEVVNNAVNANQPFINNTPPEKLVIYMNPTTMSAFLTLLETNAIGRNTVNIETDGNLVTKIAGVRVVVTGTLVPNSPQTPQGTTIQASLDSGQALPTGKVLIINEDYLTFHQQYDTEWRTDSFVASMVTVVRQQCCYLPIVRPWLNGMLLDISSCLTNSNALNVNILNK